MPEREARERCIFHPDTPAVDSSSFGPLCEVCVDRNREAADEARAEEHEARYGY